MQRPPTRVTALSRNLLSALSAPTRPALHAFINDSRWCRTDSVRPSSQLAGSTNILPDTSREERDETQSSRTSNVEQAQSSLNLAPLSGSAKLFADAVKEEAEERVRFAKLSVLEQEYENWTGEENIKDAVLRMLVDKYKPLRTGSIQTAEEKMKQTPPKVGSPSLTDEFPSTSHVKLTPEGSSWASEPLLKATEGHQPWHTTFKVPEHAVASVKLAQIPPLSAKPSGAPLPLDDKERRLEREHRKRTEQGIRLTQARESTLEYRLGIRHEKMPTSRPKPVSMKGWTSLVEERIEKARQAGAFSAIKGRGQPLTRSTDEHNPFIAREEFLMNRIIQKNQAAPPWIETQSELESSVNTFRELLRQAWIRRVIRNLTMSHPLEILRKFTLHDIKAHRDQSWVEKEKSYHETAIAELNALVRKYNGLAPYAVRRAYYSREAEIGRLYDECAPEILRQIAERGEGGQFRPAGGGEGVGSPGSTEGHATGLQSDMQGNPAGVEGGSFMKWIRGVFHRWFGTGT